MLQGYVEINALLSSINFAIADCIFVSIALGVEPVVSGFNHMLGHVRI